MEQDTRPDEPMLSRKATPRPQLVPPSEHKAAAAENGYLLAVNGLDNGYAATPKANADKARGGLCSCLPPNIGPQILVAMSCFLLTAGCGFPIGFSAIMLPQLDNSTVGGEKTSVDMKSWIASIHSAATPLGALASSWLSENLGRRTTLQICVAPFTLGWVILSLANSHAIVLVGRVVCGVAVGLSAAPCQVYLGEVTTPRVRDLVSGSPMVAYSMGILIVYSLGSNLEWHIVAALSMTMPLLALVALSCMPESPVWLARKRSREDARKSLYWLRKARQSGTSPQVERELNEIMDRTEKENRAGNGAFHTFRILFTRPEAYKPFIIVNMFNMSQIFSGTFLVIFYAVDILRDSSESFDEYKAAVATAAVRVVFAVVACVLLFNVRRRRMAIVSGLLSGAAAIGLGVVVHLNEMNTKGVHGEKVPTSTEYSYAIAGLLVLYIALNTSGFFVMPIVTIGELLPARVRGVAGGLTFFAYNAVLFAATKIFPLVSDKAGVGPMFWFFGCSTLVGTLLVWLFLPESRGLSLGEVEDYFSRGNFLWVTRDRSLSPTPAPRPAAVASA